MMLSRKSAPDPAFDPSFLDVYTGGDRAVRDQVLEMFLEQSALLLERLREAQGDKTAWHQAAHSLKGCAGGIGAAGLAELARTAEQGCGDGEPVHIKLLQELEVLVSATNEKIRELLAS